MSISIGIFPVGRAPSSAATANYSPVPPTAKKYMTETEWAYWYEGKPAPSDITDPYGVPMEKAGTVRDGGSFVKRVTNIVCWNTLMDEAAYMNKRWNDFKVA
jgi:putative spermidine/putrescine transport system substrate-binding protein